MARKIVFIVITLLFCRLINGYGQADWELKTDKEGIKVYTIGIGQATRVVVPTTLSVVLILNRLWAAAPLPAQAALRWCK